MRIKKKKKDAKGVAEKCCFSTSRHNDGTGFCGYLWPYGHKLVWEQIHNDSLLQMRSWHRPNQSVSSPSGLQQSHHMEWQHLNPYCIITEHSGLSVSRATLTTPSWRHCLPRQTTIVCRCRLEGIHPYKQWPQYSTDTLLIEHVIAACIAKHSSGRILQGNQSKWHC